MFEQVYLENAISEFRNLKVLAEKAVAQSDAVSGDLFFHCLDDESNSIALIYKHMAGNMISRWTDFLTTDGEKPLRNRDGEFVVDSAENRTSIDTRWEEGWGVLFATLMSLNAEDLGKEVTIRGSSISVVAAINRQLTHYGQHVGQIVLLSKHFAGSKWQSLSIPRKL
ncbi:MAG: DUF1572 family protein [candidate division Zixibacteria bacterium]|nr:DUF1572 family protein [candidate division Zixibacteria bacterium]